MLMYEKVPVESEQVTANNNEYRYIVFHFREKGQMATRVHGINGQTIPYMTKDMDFTSATRTVMRDINLLVLRGANTNSHMIGPCDFYGPLERPHLYLYTIEIDEGFPRFFRRDRSLLPIENSSLSSDFTDCSVEINAIWFRGDHDNIDDIKSAYITGEQKIAGESLFPTVTGLLSIKHEGVKLPNFDASKFDLTPFKARLVKNDTPFSIADSYIPRSDSFCPVSYMFEGDYAREQIDKGGGLFLETHDFCQTMTPLDEMASGRVILGRWLEETVMQLIGVRIPYGYTLIIENGCIHGDTPLRGMYMMAMTSNHITMQTADVVFLKNRETGRNFIVSYEEEDGECLLHHNTPQPIVHFGDDENAKEEFNLQVNNGWSVYNPLSRVFNPFYYGEKK